MKKIILLLALVSLCFINQSMAAHGKGGWVQYKYLGPGPTPGTSVYHITATFYYKCNSSNNSRTAYMGIYDAGTLANIALDTLKTAKRKGPKINKVQTYYGNDYNEDTVIKTTYAPCLSPAPTVDINGICYAIATYDTSAVLTDNNAGYLITMIGNGGRTSPLLDITLLQEGNETFVAKIPGLVNGVQAHNSSPSFIFKDTAVICYGAYFTYQFSAVDSIDHDSVSYSFVNGLTANNADKNYPPSQFYPLSYASPFGASQPLGNSVTIDPKTGLITGFAPSITGEFLIDVQVYEWRNGVVIDSIVKEMQVEVNNCTISGAELNKVYVNCDNFTLSLQNLSTASNITSYLWTFGDTTNGQPNTSTSPLATHTYSKAGDYIATLQVTTGTVTADNYCTDRVEAQIRVYPGYKTKMHISGSCYQNPFSFTDVTSTSGDNKPAAWLWTFGDLASGNNNTAIISNPSHTFPQQTGTYQVILKDSSNKGCVGSDTEQVVVAGKAYDTLTVTACNSYTWHGATYSQSGYYSFDTISTGATHCDSLTALKLTINTSSSSTKTTTLCAPNTYIWNGTTYKTSGTYNIHLTNAAGCDSIATLTLTVDTLPVVSPITASPSVDTVGTNQTITLRDNTDNGAWLNIDPSVASLTSVGNTAKVISLKSGLDTIRYFVSNNCGADTANYGFDVIQDNVFIPNIFTPDAASNRLFYLRANASLYPEVELWIFNQWGNQVFHKKGITDASGDGWDGTFNGKPQPSGVYVYAAKLTTQSGTTITKKGSITLIR